MSDSSTHIQLLESPRACREAIKWRTIQPSDEAAWHACHRGDWLLRAAAWLEVDRRLIVRAACDCAEAALQFVPAGEDGPRKAIETARRWCDGQATIDEMRAAAYAANYPDYINDAVLSAAANAAAYAAAYAADYTDYTDYTDDAVRNAAINAAVNAAANAAVYAANAAAADTAGAVDAAAAARASSLAESAHRVRAAIPWHVVQDAITHHNDAQSSSTSQPD